MVDALGAAGGSFPPRPRRAETHVDVEDDVGEEAASVRGRDGHLEHVGRHAGRRVGAGEEEILVAQGNLANSYQMLGWGEEALAMRRDMYSGRLTLMGEEHLTTLVAANNYALSLNDLKRFEETRALLRRKIPVARRVLGEANDLTLKMRWNYAVALYRDDGATLDDLREAVKTLEEADRTARRVLGCAHPTVVLMETSLPNARAALRAREESDVCDAMAAMAPGDA